MKKRGFTITELLITLAIIGIAAALAGPAVVNLMPDKNKAMFMKNYKELSTLTQKMLDDPELYYKTYEIQEENEDTDGDGKDDKFAGRKYPNCTGLECTGEALRAPYSSINFTTQDKFASLFSDLLGAEEIISINTTDGNFKTPDGTLWLTENYGDGDVCYNVYITVNSNPDKDCAFNPGTCKNPNKFTLTMDAYGNITAHDALSKAYLLDPTNYNNKKKDMTCAEEIKKNPDKDPAEVCKDLDY